ncbi:PREDICTED: interferon-induced protein with tetratricopeptide repeats 2-like [Condylura cristata]|uniref:interferon-induced protein with tetratricopeptide repeats 2-like n=1 Tax=Condylura cristata TaxID=143302 RepID=UPI000642C691|nr:PREDICTED: interferon-induced protein with tetratricopeptide repeats 2-like [Condylura cristata]
MESGVLDQINNLKTEFKATMCNLLAYIKSCRGQNDAALKYLQQAEAFTQEAHDGHQAELRSLVTWGNYAWVHYRNGNIPKSQIYVEKVKQICDMFSSPDSIQFPELYNEEGWALLKCGKQNERAMVCFQKALERKPDNPEFTTGLAIAVYRLDESLPRENLIDLLKKAIQLDPENQYVKVLLALKLQKMNKIKSAESLVEEVLLNAPCTTDVLEKAARLYYYKGDLDRGIELLLMALESVPDNSYLQFTIGSYYRKKVLQKVPGKKYMSPEEKQKFEELIQQGLYHLRRANEINGHYSTTCLYIGDLYNIRCDFENADFYYRQEFTKELTPVAKQRIHLHYGNFLLNQLEDEHTAIYHFKEGVKIQEESYEKEKMEKGLQKIANEFYRKGKHAQAESILEFLQEQKREMQPARDISERGLDS